MSLPDQSNKSIFLAALEIATEADREEFLKQACGENESLRAEIESMIIAHNRPLKFIADMDQTQRTVDLIVHERPGTQIGPYKLREQIGEGGFGTVYVAEQEEPVARKVALKVIKPGMDTRTVVARFEAERQALAMMDHPNIARVLDAGATESGRPYFVMELVRGTSLTTFCDAQKLGARDRLRLFIDVCRAVQHAHQKGIIHRDLKPSNIMVTMRDDRPIPKVIDFGVAKALSQKLTDKTVYTAYGQLMGTPLYMSPEQAQMNEVDVDTRSDVYSLGILLYELLTGTTPFDGETIKNASFDELRRIIREDDPPRPSDRVSTLRAEQLSTVSSHREIDAASLTRSLRGELDWVVMKSLEKDRNRRYESASDFAADVENFLNNEPVRACPPSMRYQLQKFAQRNKTALTTAALVALVLIIGTTVSVGLAVRAMAAETTLELERQAAIETADRAQKNAQAAKRERNAAVIAREKLRRVLYASELNRVQSAWEAGSYRRVMQILESTRPQPGETDLRGFEWHYWNRQVNGPLETRAIDIPHPGTGRLLDDTLSPDGSTLAVEYQDEHAISVAIWDVADRKEICHLNRGTDKASITGMFFSPDGTRLAILVRGRRQLEIWDARTGACLFQREDDARVGNVFFSRDGNRVVVKCALRNKKGSRRDTFEYKVWDLKSDQITFRHQFENGLSASVLFLSPDGKNIGVSSYKPPSHETKLQILNAETAQVINERTFASYLFCKAMSADGTRLAVRVESRPNQSLILDARSLETISTLTLDNHDLTELAFSTDDRLLAASTRSSKVGSVSTAKVLIWNLDNAPKVSHKVLPPAFTLRVPSPAKNLRFTEDSKQLRSLILGRLWTWSIPEELATVTARHWSDSAILGGSFNRDGTRAVMRTAPTADFQQASAVLAWDVEADQKLWLRQAADDRTFSMPVMGPDSRYVVVPSQQRRLSGGNAEPGTFSTQIHVLDGHTGHNIRDFKPTNASDINDVVFAPDGRHVAVFVVRRSNNDDLHWSRIPASIQLVVWNVVTGDEVFAVPIDDDDPNLCGFTPDGKELMIGRHTSGGLLVLDATTGATRRIIAPTGTTSHQSWKWSLSPDRKTLALVGSTGHSRDISVTLFAAKTGALLRQVPIETGFSSLGICWTPDSRRFALASELHMRNPISNGRLAGQVTIWDVDTGRLLLTLNREGLATGHDGAIRFSPDNHHLLHIAADNRFERGREYLFLHPIHIWDATPLPSTSANR